MEILHITAIVVLMASLTLTAWRLYREQRENTRLHVMLRDRDRLVENLRAQVEYHELVESAHICGPAVHTVVVNADASLAGLSLASTPMDPGTMPQDRYVTRKDVRQCLTCGTDIVQMEKQEPLGLDRYETTDIWWQHVESWREDDHLAEPKGVI